MIVIAGDVEPSDVLARVERYFGDIPSGPPVDRQREWIAKRTGEKRVVLEDRVPQGRVVFSWNVPGVGNPDTDDLDLLSTILTEGKTSPLYKRLVFEDQIATDVVSFVWPHEIGSTFVVWATAAPGQELAHVESVLDEELQAFLLRGPTREELDLAKVQHRAAFVRGIERIGGFGGKSDILASSQVFGGSPDAYQQTLARFAQATVRDVDDAAQRWLTDGRLVMEVRPFPNYTTTAATVDRSKLPVPGPPPEAPFPSFQRARLSNGLELIVAERHDVPVVGLRLLVDSGYAADEFDHGKEGTASLALSMLDEGTETRDAMEISRELAELGAELSSGSNLDMANVTFSALVENLDPSLELFADVVLHPAFREKDFERLKNQQLAAIQRELVTPQSMALRLLPRLLYGKGHAYGISFTGSGTTASVEAIDRDALKAFHDTWFKPNNATLVVVGDTTLAEIQPRLEKLFASWQPGAVPKKEIAKVPLAESTSVYLVDRPGSLQSIIFAGNLAPPTANPDEPAIEAMNEVIGGGFTSRININLREDKHWAYGAYSFLVDAEGQRPFMVYAPVQTDKTVDSMLEIRKELEGIIGPHPPTQKERDRAVDHKTLTLPGQWETASAVGASIADIVRFGFPDDYWDTYPEAMRAQTVESITRAAREVLHPDRLTWVVVGDRARIEKGILAAGFGPIHLVDPDGQPVAGGAEH